MRRRVINLLLAAGKLVIRQEQPQDHAAFDKEMYKGAPSHENSTASSSSSGPSAHVMTDRQKLPAAIPGRRHHLVN